MSKGRWQVPGYQVRSLSVPLDVEILLTPIIGEVRQPLCALSDSTSKCFIESPVYMRIEISCLVRLFRFRLSHYLFLVSLRRCQERQYRAEDTHCDAHTTPIDLTLYSTAVLTRLQYDSTSQMPFLESEWSAIRLARLPIRDGEPNRFTGPHCSIEGSKHRQADAVLRSRPSITSPSNSGLTLASTRNTLQGRPSLRSVMSVSRVSSRLWLARFCFLPLQLLQLVIS